MPKRTSGAKFVTVGRGSPGESSVFNTIRNAGRSFGAAAGEGLLNMFSKGGTSSPSPKRKTVRPK